MKSPTPAFAFLLAGLLSLGGCATAGPNHGFVKTELYLGTGQPGGGSISQKEWQAFLDTEITPRFPHGLTILDSSGQYRSQSGQLVREKTKILVVVHKATQEEHARLEAIRSRYKERFRQEMVLEVEAPVKAVF